MSTPTVEEMIDDILRREGGYVDAKEDRGGTTNHGISLRYARGRGLDLDGDGIVTRDDIRLVTPEIAAQVYREDFFEAPRIDGLPPPLQPQMFDMAVNHGPGGAVRMLQRVVNDFEIPQIHVDGEIGAETRAAVFKLVERVGWERVNNALVDERKAFYRRLIKRDPSQKRFERGWLKRAEEFRVPELVPTPPVTEPAKPAKPAWTDPTPRGGWLRRILERVFG